MKLKNSKTCNGCKASELNHRDERICGLGFKMEIGPEPWRIWKPAEPCPKPKTYEERSEIYKEMNP